MKILFVGDYPNSILRYKNVFFQNLVFEFAKAGHDCTIINPVSITKYKKSINKISKIREEVTTTGEKIRVFHPRFISFSSKKIGDFNTGILSEKMFERAVIKSVKKINEEFDFIYGHFFIYGGLAAVKVGNLLNRPSFIAYGECNYETEVVSHFRNLKYKDIGGISGIIAVSTNNANVLKSKDIFQNVPIIVAPNAIDNSLFFKRDKLECRDELGLPKDKFIVGFVGGFENRKGDKRLLEAINRIDGVYVAFAGRGENPPQGDKVLFCSPLVHDMIPIFLNAIDIFCLPTLNEGSCNAIVEAASCELPIISSDLPFNDDLLTINNSIRIDPTSVDDIETAVRKLYLDSELMGKIAKQVKSDSKKFTLKQRQRNIFDFIQEIIKGGC